MRTKIFLLTVNDTGKSIPVRELLLLQMTSPPALAGLVAGVSPVAAAVSEDSSPPPAPVPGTEAPVGTASSIGVSGIPVNRYSTARSGLLKLARRAATTCKNQI